MTTDASDVESIAARGRLSGPQTEVLKSTIQKIKTDQDLNDEERFATEAIIIPDKRPAIDIINGDFRVEHPLWTKFSTDPALHASIKKAIPSVGRIELPSHPSLPYGGTGFVVGKDLLMTNRHVAELFASGLGTRQLSFKSGLSAGVDFEREKDSNTSTVINVRMVVMIHPFWDMALLQVDGLSQEHVPLVLSVRDPEEIIGTEIAVIGYPAFDSRNDPAVQNQVFRGLYNVKRLQPGLIKPRASVNSFGKTVSALCHDSSTLGGNSGSEVFDPRGGKVVALHFAGVYLDKNYCVPTAELARDGRVVDAGVNFEPGASGGTPAWEAWWRKLEEEQPQPASHPIAAAAPGRLLAPGESASWTFPVEISIRVGARAAAAAAGADLDRGNAAAVETMVAPAHDPDYSTRKGYDPKFLGVPAPAPEPSRPEIAVRLGKRFLIPYHHFSLALHKDRRIALFTVANLDASANAKTPEEGRKYDRKTLGGLGKNDMEKWFSDPRIDPAFQLPDRFFTKDKGAFDKGHIVRREDVAWGESFDEVQAANGDTFHVTNCSPQVSGFNQSARGADNWGDLENYVLKQADADKLSIFAGPVLAKDDPFFLGVDDVGPVRVQIPRQYWKVVLARDGGKLQSFGFVLRQDLSDTPLEFAVDATWEKYMISIADLEEMNPLVRFDEAIHGADQAASVSGEAIRQGLDLAMTSK